MTERQHKLRLGGMALANGLLVHGPTHWAAAVRRRDGTIGVTSGPKPRARGPVERVPGARGVIRLGEAMLVIPLVKRALPEARLPFQEGKVIAAGVAATAAGAALSRRGGGPAVGAAVAVASVGAAVEVFAWSERHSGTALSRVLRRPGYELQRLVCTREPTEEQLEVGRAALAEILRVERADASR